MIKTFPFFKDILKDAKRWVLSIRLASSRHDLGSYQGGCICSVKQPGTVPLPPPAPRPAHFPLRRANYPSPPGTVRAPPALQFPDSIFAVPKATIPNQSESWTRACDWLAAPGAGPDLPPSI